jgi:hypothetical protein
MDGNDRQEDQTPTEITDVLGDALGTDRSRDEGTQMSRGRHGTVTGDDDLNFDLESCEIVTQTYDNESSAGTRLYHVEDDIYALSQYRRSVSQDWAETLILYGELSVEPITLEADPIETSIKVSGADPLSDEQIAHVTDSYSTECADAVWENIESNENDSGPVLRGPIACVEDHAWRESLRPTLADQLDKAQVEAVTDALMDARPDIDWTWCQLYAVYVTRLLFDERDTTYAVSGDGSV